MCLRRESLKSDIVVTFVNCPSVQENAESVSAGLLGLAARDCEAFGLAQCSQKYGHIRENDGKVGPWTEHLHMGPCTLHHGSVVGGGDYPPPLWRSY
jgi:hypothetical protein